MVTVRVVQDKRNVVVLLVLSGFDTVEEAKAAIVEHLNEEGVSGDGGEIEAVEATDAEIDVETDLCGFGISDVDIEQAMRMGGREHACS